MNHKAKIKAFLENTRRLNKHFSVTPLLYGSLGLEYVTGEDFSADDIDILIPEYYITEGWKTFRRYLETIGYVLVDEHEHTFEKDGICYSYASIENLLPFAGIEISHIKTVKRDNVSFMILSPEQYLAVYKASAKDGYRLNVKEKKDNEKIELINKFLENKKKESSKRKKLKITRFCRMTPFAAVAFCFFISFLLLITAVTFVRKEYDIAACLCFVDLVVFVAIGFYFNYGITVSGKYVSIIYFNELRFFRYEDVTKIELWLDSDMIVGSVKAKKEKEYDFCFSDFSLAKPASLMPKLWDVTVKLSDKRMKNIKTRSLDFEKVKVHCDKERK